MCNCSLWVRRMFPSIHLLQHHFLGDGSPNFCLDQRQHIVGHYLDSVCVFCATYDSENGFFSFAFRTDIEYFYWLTVEWV